PVLRRPALLGRTGRNAGGGAAAAAVPRADGAPAGVTDPARRPGRGDGGPGRGAGPPDPRGERGGTRAGGHRRAPPLRARSRWRTGAGSRVGARAAGAVRLLPPDGV